MKSEEYPTILYIGLQKKCMPAHSNHVSVILLFHDFDCVLHWETIIDMKLEVLNYWCKLAQATPVQLRRLQWLK